LSIILDKENQGGKPCSADKLLMGFDIQVRPWKTAFPRTWRNFIAKETYWTRGLSLISLRARKRNSVVSQGGWEEPVKDEKVLPKRPIALPDIEAEGEVQEKEKTLFGYLAVETGLWAMAELIRCPLCPAKIESSSENQRIGRDTLTRSIWLQPRSKTSLLYNGKTPRNKVTEDGEWQSLSSEDRLLRDLILKNNILIKNSAGVHSYIRARMRELGYQQDLADHIWQGLSWSGRYKRPYCRIHAKVKTAKQERPTAPLRLL